jgi:hypothetical protein
VGTLLWYIFNNSGVWMFSTGSHVLSTLGYPHHLTKYWSFLWPPKYWWLQICSTLYSVSLSIRSGGGWVKLDLCAVICYRAIGVMYETCRGFSMISAVLADRLWVIFLLLSWMVHFSWTQACLTDVASSGLLLPATRVAPSYIMQLASLSSLQFGLVLLLLALFSVSWSWFVLQPILPMSVVWH